MSEHKIVDIRGLIDSYEFPYTLPGSGKELMIKPITTGQMKRVLAYEDETNPYIVEEVLDKLISESVITEGFDVGEIYLQDRFSLLLELRKITKGDMYTFNWKCPKCRVENIHNVSLSGLEVKPYNNDDNVLTVSEKLKFEVDFPTRNDQKDAIKRVAGKKLSYRERQVDVQTGTFANSIKKVHTPDGIHEDVPYGDKVFILENISTEVFAEFTKWFADHEFGTAFKTEYKCFSCHDEGNLDIPLSDFFV